MFTSRLKPFLRWLVLGTVLFFLLNALRTHWRDIATLRIEASGFASLAIAIGITLLAHIFAGYVWAWILKGLNYPVAGAWGAKIYLRTNIAKYLPGNIWHFYGRIAAATKAEIPVEVATLSVVLESLLMAAAACLLLILGAQRLIEIPKVIFLQGLLLIGILITIHPRFLSNLLKQISRLKKSSTPVCIEHYPIIPMLGELGFLGLRSLGFIVAFSAVTPVDASDLPLLVSAFAGAWLLGFVMPGLPGGVGVFEAVAIALLGQHFPSGETLAAVALYRLVNTIAEGLGAGLVVLDEKLLQ